MNYMSDIAPFVNLGQQLKQTREQSHQSLAEVSGAVEIEETVLERIEAGFERPAEDILLLLISHFGVQDHEALRLWQLASYDSDIPEQLRADVDLINSSKIVMLMALDMRTIYSDGLTIDANKSGLTLQFSQTSGNNTSNPVARIGMSYEQAEEVLNQMTQAMLKHKYNGNHLSLSAGELPSRPKNQ